MPYKDELFTYVVGYTGKVSDFCQLTMSPTGRVESVLLNPHSEGVRKVVDDRNNAKPYLIEALSILARYEVMRVGMHLEINPKDNIGWCPFAGWGQKGPFGPYRQIALQDSVINYLGRRDISERQRDGDRLLSNHMVIDTILTHPVEILVGKVDQFEVSTTKGAYNLARSILEVLNAPDRQTAKDISLAARIAAGQRRADYLNARGIANLDGWEAPESLVTYVNGRETDLISEVEPGTRLRLLTPSGRPLTTILTWNPGNNTQVQVFIGHIREGCKFELAEAPAPVEEPVSIEASIA